MSVSLCFPENLAFYETDMNLLYNYFLIGPGKVYNYFWREKSLLEEMLIPSKDFLLFLFKTKIEIGGGSTTPPPLRGL